MRIRWIGPRHEKKFGSIKKNFSKYCYEVFYGRRKICRSCPASKALKDGKIHKTSQIITTKDKKKKYYLVTATPIKNRNNKITQILELIQDITKNKNKEKRRSTVVNRYKSACEHLLDANKKLKVDVISLKNIYRRTDELHKNLKKEYLEKTSKLKFVKEEINDIYKVNRALSSTSDLKQALNTIVKFSKKITGADAASLKLIKPLSDNIIFSDISVGLSKYFVSNSSLKIGEGVQGIVAATKAPIIIKDSIRDPRVKYPSLAKQEGIYSTIAVPAIFNNELLGVISVYFKRPKKISNEEMEQLRNFAIQAALAIQETKLYQDVHINYFNTIHTLVLAMEARDPYTMRHSERVTQYSIKIARSLKLSSKQIETLTYAGKVHDVGKIAISDSVLNKPGKLTIAERALIELHPVKGAEMLVPLSFLKEGIPCVKHHHERFDGNGYPDGLKKEKIPITARIVACADSFDAMTSDRPYRFRKLTINEAIKELEVNTGKQFDPRIIPVFVKIIKQS